MVLGRVEESRAEEHTFPAPFDDLRAVDRVDGYGGGVATGKGTCIQERERAAKQSQGKKQRAQQRASYARVMSNEHFFVNHNRHAKQAGDVGRGK